MKADLYQRDYVLVRHWSLPLAGILVIPVIGLMFWQYRAQEHIGMPKWNSRRPPFPGLEPFAEDDAGIFFGREAEISQLFDRLNPSLPRKAARIIPVVGPSGVGKSSLVQASLVPRLRKSRRHWSIASPMMPGSDPVKNLATSLSGMGIDSPGTGAVNADNFANLSKDSRPTRASRTSNLLIIDQAEELLTLTGARGREQFLDFLAQLLASNPDLWVIMILRSDFLTRFLQGRFAGWFRSPVVIGALTNSALLELIQRPALEAGLQFEPLTLPQTIVSECSSGMALPLLAYMLHELYLSSTKSKTLSEPAYRSLGAVSGVIAKQADKVTVELISANADAPVMETLTKFVTINSGAFTRRRVMRSTLTREESQVVDGFIAARLLVGDTEIESSESDAVVEVAHEALFEHWAPLRQELEARADMFRLRADLERWADDWVKSNRNQEYLLQGERLDLATKWASTVQHLPKEYPEIAEFINHSQAVDQATMRRLSESIAGKAVANIGVDPEHSIRLALAAYEDCWPTRPAYEALAAAVAASRVRLTMCCGDRRLRGVAWCPKEARIAVASDDSTAYIWDLAAGRLLAVLRGHSSRLRAVAWSPDGLMLATASDDTTARIWDPASNREIGVLQGHTQGVWGIAWSPDGKYIATSSQDRTVRVWDSRNQAELLVLRGHEDWVDSVAWSPDGKRLASASHDCTARLWDLSPDADAVLIRHTAAVIGVAWSPDGRQIATGSSDRTARISVATDGSEVAVLRGHSGELKAVAWSPDGRYLATASHDRSARIWDIRQGVTITTLRGHQDQVWSIAWCPDSRSIATASHDCTARTWSIEQGMEKNVIRGHDDWIQSTTWSPGSKYIATASSDGTARIWIADDGTQFAALRGHDGPLRGIDWSPDDRWIATASSDNTARIWDWRDGSCRVTLRGHDSGLWGVAWSPDCRRIATTSNDHTIRIWDTENGRQLAVLRGHTDWVRGICWSPDGHLLASASEDTTAAIWHPSDGTRLTVLRGHDAELSCVDWSPDGARLVTASLDTTARIWSPTTEGHLAILSGHTDWVLSAKWSLDAKRIVTASCDRTARIWESDTAAEIALLVGHSDDVAAADWSPDGSLIATGSYDRTIRIWDSGFDATKLVQLAQTRTTRMLNSEERRALLMPGKYTALTQAAQAWPQPGSGGFSDDHFQRPH